MGILSGKVAVITGGTSGIGQASAELFAAEGASVVIVGRRRVEGETIGNAIREAGGNAGFVEADLSDDLAVARMVADATACFGRVDIWFNNAGVGGGRGGIEVREAADWDRISSVNARAAFLCLKAEVGQLRAQGTGGSIIFNASVLGSVGFPGTMIYGASKAAVIAMARAAAVELGPEGIRVNTVSPSITRTPMTSAWFEANSAGQASDPLSGVTPLRRPAEPHEVAGAALFLASDLASYVTGHDLRVDGGLSAG